MLGESTVQIVCYSHVAFARGSFQNIDRNHPVIVLAIIAGIVEVAGIEPGERRFSKLLIESEMQLKMVWDKGFAKSYRLSWFTRICWNFLLK